MYSMLFTKAFLNGLAYRARYFVSLAGQIVYRFIQMSVWVALLGAGGVSGDIRQMSTYVILTGILGPLMLDGVGQRMGKRILSGDVAMDMIKPYSLKSYFLFQELGESLYYLLMVSLPALIVIGIVFPPTAPVNVYAGVMSVLLAVVGAGINFSMYYVLGLWVFWLKNDWYISWIGGAFMTLFGGAVVPLWMYPDWLAAISRFLPFQYMRYQAAAVYLGQSALDPLLSLIIALGWLLFFTVLERDVWKAAQRRLFSLGG